MAFYDECVKVTTTDRIHIEIEDLNVPDKYITATNSIIEIMRPKLDKLKIVSIGFIESELVNKNKFISKLEASTDDGDIPDAIICKLARGLYDKSINEVTDEQQTIIKVLACYICILK